MCFNSALLLFLSPVCDRLACIAHSDAMASDCRPCENALYRAVSSSMCVVVPERGPAALLARTGIAGQTEARTPLLKQPVSAASRLGSSTAERLCVKPRRNFSFAFFSCVLGSIHIVKHALFARASGCCGSRGCRVLFARCDHSAAQPTAQIDGTR